MPRRERRIRGYFKPGSRALIVGRYSTVLHGTRSGHYRSLALVGKLYPTTDRDHPEPYRTANFITQEDLGGAGARRSMMPNSATRRHNPVEARLGLPVLLVSALAFQLADKQPTIRQLYPIAELGKPEDEPTRSPEFMHLVVHPDQPRVAGDRLDFREEILAQIYDKGEGEPRRTLTFNIEVSDQGHTKGSSPSAASSRIGSASAASYSRMPWLPTMETSSSTSTTRPGETVAMTRPA